MSNQPSKSRQERGKFKRKETNLARNGYHLGRGHREDSSVGVHPPFILPTRQWQHYWAAHHWQGDKTDCNAQVFQSGRFILKDSVPRVEGAIRDSFFTGEAERNSKEENLETPIGKGKNVNEKSG